MKYHFSLALSVSCFLLFPLNRGNADNAIQQAPASPSHEQKAFSFFNENSDSAIFHYHKALEQVNKDSGAYPDILTNLSILYKNKGQYERALEHAFEALPYLEKPSRTKASCLNTIATVYSRTGDQEKALDYHYKVLVLRKQISYERGIGMSFNNIGYIYNELELYDSAIANFTKSLEIKKVLNDTNGITATLHNLGWTYFKKEDYNESEKLLMNALKLKSEVNDQNGLVYTINLLGRLHLKKGQMAEAKQYLDSTARLAAGYKLLDITRQNLFDQSEYYRLAKDYKRQGEILSRYILVNDSLLNQEKARALSEMQVKYDTEQKDQEISYLQSIEEMQKVEIAYQQKVVLITSIALSILIFFLVVIIYLLWVNRRKKASIENLNVEMQHRIKNNLQILSNLLKLQTNHLKDTQAITVLKVGESRVNAMALIHQLLYTSQDKKQINAAVYIPELCRYLNNSFLGTDKIKLQLELQEITIDVEQMVSIGLIINELVTNSIKHAFQETPHPEIGVRLKILESGRVFLEVRDNGRGVEDDLLVRTRASFGVKLVQMLSKQLHAESNVFNKHGAIFQFSIPL